MNSQFVESFAWILLHFLWQGTCIALVYKSIESLELFRSSRQRYMIGLLCLTCMLLCPVATFLLRDSVITSLQQRPISSITDTVVAGDNNSLGDLWSFCVIGIWITGVGLQGIRLLLGYWRLRRWQSDLLPLPDSLMQRSSEFALRLGLSRFYRIYLSIRVREAMAVGFFKPMILVPASWLTQLPTPTLEAVIAHELAHIRRFDLWVNLYQRTAETLLFYHPAVWWISSKIHDERELCCDEIAARTTGKNLEYALALEEVARCVYRETPLLGMSFSGEKNMKLLKRVRHVLGLSTMAKRSLWWPAGLLALMLPLTFYASSLLADNDDDNRKPEQRPTVERREGEREVRREREDREDDGDRDDDDDDRERDRDRPRTDRERDGDRPRPDRRPGDGPLRDPNRPPREGFRPDGPPPIGPRPDGPRPPFGDRETPFRDRLQDDNRPRPDSGRPLPPFARRDDDLRREVEQLRREVAELRELLQRQRAAQGPPRRDGDTRPEPPRGERPPGERRPPGDFPPRGERREGDGPRFRGPREGGREADPERPREGERREPSPESRERAGERNSRPETVREGGPERPREGERREPSPESRERAGERAPRPETVRELERPETKDE